VISYEILVDPAALPLGDHLAPCLALYNFDRAALRNDRENSSRIGGTSPQIRVFHRVGYLRFRSAVLDRRHRLRILLGSRFDRGLEAQGHLLGRLTLRRI